MSAQSGTIVADHFQFYASQFTKYIKVINSELTKQTSGKVSKSASTNTAADKVASIKDIKGLLCGLIAVYIKQLPKYLSQPNGTSAERSAPFIYWLQNTVYGSDRVETEPATESMITLANFVRRLTDFPKEADANLLASHFDRFIKFIAFRAVIRMNNNVTKDSVSENKEVRVARHYSGQDFYNELTLLNSLGATEFLNKAEFKEFLDPVLKTNVIVTIKYFNTVKERYDRAMSELVQKASVAPVSPSDTAAAVKALVDPSVESELASALADASV